MEIAEALRTLDPEHAGHWTSDGAPRLDVLAGIVGRKLTRADIAAEAPGFNRDSHRAELALLAEATDEAGGEDEADVAYPRTWLYHLSCPGGRVFEGAACAAALEDGWVDSPTKVPTVGGSKPNG